MFADPGITLWWPYPRGARLHGPRGAPPHRSARGCYVARRNHAVISAVRHT
eukprot:COSAG02_NODE_68_length_42582_cov_52.351129_46_plen_51_part_00